MGGAGGGASLSCKGGAAANMGGGAGGCSTTAGGFVSSTTAGTLLLLVPSSSCGMSGGPTVDIDCSFTALSLPNLFVGSPTGVTLAGGGGTNGAGAGATESSCGELLVEVVSTRGDDIGDGAAADDDLNEIPPGTFFLALPVMGGGTLNPPHFFFTEDGEADVVLGEE